MRSFIALAFIILLIPWVAFTQKKIEEEPEEIEYLASDSIVKISKKVLSLYASKADSIESAFDLQKSKLISNYDYCSDSLYRYVVRLEPRWRSYWSLFDADIKSYLDASFNPSLSYVKDLEQQGKSSISKISLSQFDDGEQAFDSMFYSGEYFTDSIQNYIEGSFWSATDTIDKYKDSARSFYELMIDKRQFGIDSLEDVVEKAPRLQIDLGFANKVNYNGRNFGVIQYGFTPEVRYRFKSGFSIYTTGYIWSGYKQLYTDALAHNSLAKIDVGIDYTRQITKKWEIEGGYARWFFTNGSTADRFSLVNAFQVYTGYNLDFLYFGFFNMYIFGTEHLFISSPEISKYIEYTKIFTKKDKLYLEPGVKVVVGQNYQIDPSKAKADPNNNYFGLLNVEFFIPVNYELNNFTYTVSFNECFPQHAPPGNPVKPFFYVSANVSFYIKNKNNRNLWKL